MAAAMIKHGPDGAFIADGEALDDVGGVAGAARFLGQSLDRGELGAGEVLGARVEGDGQDDADQAGPGGRMSRPQPGANLC